MKRRVRGLTLLVAFSLLTSAATAHAECAWVLWTERGTGVGPKAPAYANVLLLTLNRASLG
jgi:hypothetical protein